MGGSVTSSGSQSVLTKSQRALLNQLSKLLIGEIGQSAEQYGGQIVPGETDLQSSIFQSLSGSFTGANQDRDAAIQDFIKTGGVDPALRQEVYATQRGLAKNEFDDFARQVEERYNAQGAGRSGGLQRSLSRGAARFSTELASLQAGLEYQDDVRRNQGIFQGIQGLSQARLGDAELAQQAGGLQRSIQGQQLAEGYNKWQAAQPYSNPWLQYLPQVFGTQASTPVTTRKGGGLLTGG